MATSEDNKLAIFEIEFLSHPDFPGNFDLEEAAGLLSNRCHQLRTLANTQAEALRSGA